MRVIREAVMAARESLDEKLASLRALRGQTLTDEQKAAVRKRIGDRSNLVVASAAAIAGENALSALASDLEASFRRFLVNPEKNDKLCRAKIAIIEALERMEHPEPEIFREASRYVQFEPVWEGQSDSAVSVRATALVALARIEGPDCLPALVDAMTDPARDVRVAASVALGAVGTESARLLLRLKARLGDCEPEVLSECLGALLTIDPKANLAFVCEHLDAGNATRCEAAALALGKSRLSEAVEPLRTCWERAFSDELKQHLLLSLAILRRPEALDFLSELVGSGREPEAIAALSALRIYKSDDRLRERVAAAVNRRDNRAIQAQFHRCFGVD